MRLPVIHGLIRRRLLVNFRVDAEVMERFLPPPFRPKLHLGYAIAGFGTSLPASHVRVCSSPAATPVPGSTTSAADASFQVSIHSQILSSPTMAPAFPWRSARVTDAWRLPFALTRATRCRSPLASTLWPSRPPIFRAAALATPSLAIATVSMGSGFKLTVGRCARSQLRMSNLLSSPMRRHFPQAV